MKTRNVLSAFAAALLLSSSAMAQFSIKGKVLDENGEPVVGATISPEGERGGSTTKENGGFLISNLSNGEYKLRFRAFGYSEKYESVEVKNADVVINIKMIPSYFMKEGVEVKGVRATEKTPTTYTNINREDIDKENYGQDLPFLLQNTPSTVVTSDAGAGVGYTGVRIRGVDPTRTNVTINGIPINDSESHGVFWVNMPDFASSIEDMQVQRGVGTSANGGAAFGASININSNQINEDAYADIDNSYGSFNTAKHTVRAGTGSINDQFVVDARLSKISSDGYIDRARSDLKSFYLSGAYFGKNTSVKANVFSGQEETYQAWYGTPESRVDGDEEAMNDYADRNFLSPEERENLLTSGRTYNFYTYENEVDSYQQDHYQVHVNHRFNNKFTSNIALHYTRGRGYYEQFRENDRFSTYGFNPIVVEGDTVDRMDLIRRRWLDNHFYGTVFYVDYDNNKNININAGGGINAYDGDHFGEVIWAEFMPNNDIRDRYYDNNGYKVDAHAYMKGTYDLNKLTFFGDMQYRYIDYTFLGVDEVDNELIDLTQSIDFEFFNPKLGLTYRINESSNIYASFAVANREPVRRDFRESTPGNRPVHETLYNGEAGYRLKTSKAFLNANLFYMDYNNQLVLTGQINDVGGYTRTNVDRSFRAGVEIEGGYKIFDNLGITGNFTYSQNKIMSFTEFVDNFDEGGQTAIQHENTDLAFSPNIIAGLSINYAPFDGAQISMMNKYVGEQFLDNTSSDNRKIEDYFISHITLSYTIKNKFFNEVTFGLRINNLFNELYENNGYTWGYILGGDRVQENFYYPQAERNFLGRVTIKL